MPCRLCTAWGKSQQFAIDTAAESEATRLSCFAFETHLAPPTKTKPQGGLPRVEFSARISYGSRIGKGCGKVEKKEEQAHECGHHVQGGRVSREVLHV